MDTIKALAARVTAASFRTKFFFVGFALVLAALLATDPDHGLSTGMLLLSTAAGFIAVVLAHWVRKALHPYVDMRTLFDKASQDPVGAGLALVAMSLIFSAVLGLFAGRANAQTPDPRSLQHLPTVKAEVAKTWPELTMPHYVAGLIAHESGCPALRSCWSPTARLKTPREEGAGLGQITRVWRPDGSIRFDSLTEMRNRHPALREWSWQNVYQRPDLQIRAVALMSRENWLALSAIPDPWERLTMTNAAYNGGRGGVQADRRACQIKPGCDPSRWWGHVETTCTKSRAPLYGQRSACDINRDHSRHVMLKEMPKYRAAL